MFVTAVTYSVAIISMDPTWANLSIHGSGRCSTLCVEKKAPFASRLLGRIYEIILILLEAKNTIMVLPLFFLYFSIVLT